MNKILYSVLTLTLGLVMSGSGCSPDGLHVPDTGWYTSNPSAASFNISTAAQLAGIAKLTNENTTDFSGKTINLTANIDLSSYGSGKGWTPISGHDAFRGNFDGKGHVISGLYINDSGKEYVGLFGSTYGFIKNLGVVIALGGITGGEQVGGIVGNGQDAVIENCYVSGGPVKGTICVGGIAGKILGFDGLINKCYTTVAVSGNDYVGGIEGQAWFSKITNCVAINTSVTATGSNKGRVAGSSNGTLTKNYALATMPGSWSYKDHDKLDGQDVSDTGSQDSSFYISLGWDFDNIWYIKYGEKYPRHW
ncbi:MAG: hypothetical protein LBC84_08870 [Prevotellaceae bacterium]|jgi:hypothetical protein|nr:hypothetical protein [Prevotellaceae bacterium]